MGQLQISGSSITGNSIRTVIYNGRTIGSLTNSLSGAIGTPQQGTHGGNYLWLLQGNSLIMLRTFKVGGGKLTITLGGEGHCSIVAPMMHEVGAGETTLTSAMGGDVVVHSIKTVSSSCRVSG